MQTVIRAAFYKDIIEPAPTAETTKDEAKQVMERMVYQVSTYLERLEDVGKFENNRSAAKKIAELAGDEVERNWIE